VAPIKPPPVVHAALCVAKYGIAAPATMPPSRASCHQPAWPGPGAPEDYRLLVPGGEIGVHVGADPLGEDSTVLLTGPATITGRVTIA